MKKFINLSLLLIISLSCSTVKKPIIIEENPTPSVEISEDASSSNYKVFDYNSSLDYIKALSGQANCVINKESFKNRLSEVTSFDFSEDNGKQVLNKLLFKKCVIRSYKTKNPLSKVNATTYKSDTTNLYLNRKNNPRAIPKMINTAIHECLHNAGYSHGDNDRKGKENSVNYKVGLIAELESIGCY